jgi:hypothetical protein
MKRKIVVTIILLFLAYHTLPSLMHYFYKSNTSESSIIQNRKLYLSACNKLNSNEGDVNELKAKRDDIYLWFHVRGLPIDEDHLELKTSEKWEELVEFWKK